MVGRLCCSRLAAEEIEDEEGVLLVGTALGQGRYTGLMQDVRVYARPLVDRWVGGDG